MFKIVTTIICDVYDSGMYLHGRIGHFGLPGNFKKGPPHEKKMYL